jgi:hypothetical protein
VVGTGGDGGDGGGSGGSSGGGTGLTDIFVDLGGTEDPEGALGITYEYILIEGDGEIVTDPAYDDKPNDMGPSFTYKPNGEGTRVDVVKVIATDSGGLSSEAFIEFLIPNIPPVATWGTIQITEHPPEVISAEAVSEGNGRYRITVIARAVHGVTATAHPIASDVADEFTTYVSLDGPNGWDFSLTEEQLAIGTPEFELPDGYEATAYTWAVDDDNDESSPRAPLDIMIPPKSDRLTYTFDIGSDGTPEANDSYQNSYSFTYSGPDGENIPANITITDDTGTSTTVDVTVNVVNRAPVFEQLATLRDEWLITFVTSAVDPDNDTVRYTLDAGDGSVTQSNGGGLFLHTFPADVYTTYNATVTARDGRGGETSHTFEITFEPEENLPPIIDSITPTVRPGGQASVAIEARDPEGEPLTITIDWGDGSPVSRVFGGSISRDLTYGPINYPITVTAADPSGQETIAFSQIDLIDEPTIISRVQQNRLADGARLFTVQAVDADSPSLRYYWDFDNDGQWDSEDNIDNSASHIYPSADEYIARIGVLDPWSGLMEETTTVVAQELPPVITDIVVTHSPRGRVHLLVEAHDPEGGPLGYEIIWGNEPELEMGGTPAYSALSGGEGDRVYDYDDLLTPYQAKVRVTDQRGLTTDEDVAIVIQDSATQLEEVSITQTMGGEVLVSLTATDADSPESLIYDFDFESDGAWEVESQLDPLAIHTYTEANVYDITIKVTDPWSGISTEETVSYELSPWNQSAIADDHVLGEEGRCVVFRVDPALVTLEAKVDPTACDDAEEEVMDWLWDFGDGFTRWGAEAGHRYVDDGIYLVTVSNQSERSPRVSQIQAHISNLAPTFVSDPVEVVSPGESYVYEVRLDDAGVSDALKLSLGEGTPAGMEIVAQPSDRVWHVVWDVPQDQPEGPIRITLIAEDGHYVDREGTEVWLGDGGLTEQRYWLTVRVGSTADGSINNNGSTDGNTNGMNSGSTGNGEDVNLEGEYTPSDDQSFAGGSYATSSCDQRSESAHPYWLLFALMGLFLTRTRRSEGA